MDSRFRDLVQLGAGWGNISGPGIFITKAFVSGLVNALFFGLTGAASCAFFYGTAALPYIVSASIGFTFGVFGFYKDAVNKAFQALDRYPLLMRLHMQNNFPSRRFDLWESKEFRAPAFRKNWVLTSMLVAGHMSATSAIERISQGEEDAIIAHELDRQRWKQDI